LRSMSAQSLLTVLLVLILVVWTCRNGANRGTFYQERDFNPKQQQQQHHQQQQTVGIRLLVDCY
jgi:hypothetical protein